MNIAILGLGVVGGGVYQILNEQIKKINDKGLTFNLKYGLVKEITPELETTFNNIQLVEDYNIIINDDSIDLIIEVLGGIEFPYQILKQALSKGKHVVSANKDLIALHGFELRQLASENNVDFYYEASVAGTIPVLNIIANNLVVDEISSFYGILNGTSNFILSKMTYDNLDYQKALTLAQELGFAESDPTADVKGLDAMRKVAILSTLSFNTKVDLNNIFVAGIDDVTSQDVKIASNNNYAIKLIGQAALVDGIITHFVMPTFVDKNHPLAGINNEINAITINSKYSKSITLSGPGAGSLPTANAIVADVIKVLYNNKFNASSYQNSCETNNYPFNEKFMFDAIIIKDEEIKYQNITVEEYHLLKNTNNNVFALLK